MFVGSSVYNAQLYHKSHKKFTFTFIEYKINKQIKIRNL